MSLERSERWFTAALVSLAVWIFTSELALAQTADWARYTDAGIAATEEHRYAEAEKQFKAAIEEAEKFGPGDTRLATSLSYLAEVYVVQQKYAEAEPLYQRALEIREKAKGPEHHDVLVSLNNLAAVYYVHGKYAEAESFYKRSLSILEKVQGPDSPEVATILNNLAELYRAQGKYAEAEPLYKRLLIIEEKALGPDDPNVAASLNNLALLYANQGKYSEAEPLYRRALTIQQKAFGADHPEVAATLNNLAELYRRQRKYSEAEPLYKNSLAIVEKAEGPDHPHVAASLNNLAQLYDDQGKHSEAEPLYRRSLEIREKALGPDHPDVAESLYNLAALCRVQGRYAEAEPLYRRALAIQEKALGADHQEVAGTLNNLGELYYSQSNYSGAEPIFKRSLTIREKALGSEHPDVAQSLNNLGALYEAQGKYAEAEPLFKRSLAIREKALGPDHPDVATSLNNLGELYHTQGNYAEAEPLFKRSLAIREKALGPDHPDVAQSLNNLALLYYTQGKYIESEPLFKHSLAIREKALGPDHPDVANSLNNLALLYYAQGKYAEAEPLYTRSLAILEKALGPDHSEIALSLNNLAGLYQAQGKYAEAEPLFKRSLAIREKALGPDHPDVAQSLNNLALLYYTQGKYIESEPLFKHSLAIREKALGPDHPDVANSLNNLALLYYAQGKYAEAEPLYKRSLAIGEKALGSEHPDLEMSLSNLAILYYGRQLPAHAEQFFDGAAGNLARQFEYHFTYMSEKDRLSFLRAAGDLFSGYLSFCFNYGEQDPTLIGKMYDVVLWQKGFVAKSIAALRGRIAASGDKEALALLGKLTAKKSQLATLLTGQPKNREEWRKNIEQLEQEANEMETALVRRSSSLAEERRLARVTWRDVQKALGKDEAAVEFVRFRFHDGKRWTDTVYYVALIVAPETMTEPKLALLGKEKELTSAPLREYVDSVGPDATSGTATQANFYDASWKPLESSLAGKKRIYFSLDGFLNEVSLGVIPAPDGQLLIEKFDLRIVSSTKDILRDKHAPATNSAVLIGDPRFDLDETKQRTIAQSFHPAEEMQTASAAKDGTSGLRSGDLQRAGLRPLRGAHRELEAVGTLLRAHHWQVESYTGENALEETVKRVRGPRVLHLATHGFFLADQERVGSGLPSVVEDPMLRSGLFFTGANRLLSGAPAAVDMDDGVLTAYEASGLNLEGTELVVLSACDTGLGQVRNGEGVFGLRRALQEDGAEAVLMSLWSAPDRETQELMTLFYENWLSGQDKYAALRQAQLTLREQVRKRYGRDLPFYWGAFVMVGH